MTGKKWRLALVDGAKGDGRVTCKLRRMCATLATTAPYGDGDSGCGGHFFYDVEILLLPESGVKLCVRLPLKKKLYSYIT